MKAVEGVNVPGVPEIAAELVRVLFSNSEVVSVPKLAIECAQLRVVNDTKVDHPLKGSKDMADAVANCIWWLNGHEAPAIVRPRMGIVRSIRR